MAKQLLLNRGFEKGLTDYYTLGKVSDYDDIANSGLKSALLLSDPTSVAEISQVVFFIVPSSMVKFSLFIKKYKSQDIQNASNIRAEVNFLSLLGTIIPPGIVISIRGKDLVQSTWHYCDGYGEVPLGAVAAQVLIRLEPPACGTSGILIDDLALVTDMVIPVPQPPGVLIPPEQHEVPVSPSTPLKKSRSLLNLPYDEYRKLYFNFCHSNDKLTSMLPDESNIP